MVSEDVKYHVYFFGSVPESGEGLYRKAIYKQPVEARSIMADDA